MDHKKIANSVFKKAVEKKARDFGGYMPEDEVSPVTKPAPTEFLKSVGQEISLKISDAGEFYVLFHVPSPLIAFLELKLVETRNSYTAIEISYLTHEGNKNLVSSTEMKGGLQWVRGMDIWSLLGKTRVSKKEISKNLDQTKKSTQKTINRILSQFDIGNPSSKTDLALEVNDKMGLGLNPNTLKRLMTIISIWEN